MALEKITMPQLGESVTEGTISTWFVKLGDFVKKYEPLAEVQTDKVVAEIPSSFTGVVKELVAKEGQTLAVGEVICYIETEATIQRTAGEMKIASPSPKVDLNETMKYRYSPAVLKMAREHQIDLEKIQGTGKGGRITRKDLQKLIELGGIPSIEIENRDEKEELASDTTQKAEQVPEQKTAPVPQIEAQASIERSATEGNVQEIPVTGVRKVIAANMVRSKHEIPHAWTMVEVDVTNLVAYRDKLKDEFMKKEGFPLTYFAFFVKAAALALKEFPIINSTWAGDKIVQKKDINISIAVATDDALYVPVIKHADEKTIKGIAREIHELALKVRSGKLSPDDVQGGTFTVNNTGSFGSIQSMGIINYPQAAILQVESIVKRPVVMNGNMIAIRDIVNLCMSLDHRVLDGLVCGRFLKRVKEILENISEETTTIF